MDSQDKRQSTHEDEINLYDYWKTIAKRKKIIIGLFLTSIILAGTISLIMPKTYQASSILAILGSVITDADGRIQRFSQPTDFYADLAKSEQLASEVIKELKLDQPPYNFTPSTLLRAIKIETRGTSPSFIVTARANSPKKAKDIANTLTEKIVKINHEMLSFETGITEDFFSRKVEIAEEELRKNEYTLLKFNKENNLGVLRQKVSNALSLRGQFELEHNNLLAQIEVSDGELKEITKNLQNEERIYKLARSITEDAAYQQIMARATGKDLSDLLGLKIKTEQVNPLYENLRTRLTNATIALATLKLSKRTLEERMKENEARLNTLHLKLASKETELGRLIRERDLAKEDHGFLARRESFVKTIAEASVGRVSIVTRAIEPTRPSGPSVMKNILIAGFLGLFFGTFLVFLQEYLSKESYTNKNVDLSQKEKNKEMI